MSLEFTLQLIATRTALLLEAMVVIIILYGALEAIVRMAGHLMHRPGSWKRREVWRQFAQWIVLSLEFALGSDIIETSIAPSWDDIGKLAAIAGIRTFLSYFLERDIEDIGGYHLHEEVDVSREGGKENA